MHRLTELPDGPSNQPLSGQMNMFTMFESKSSKILHSPVDDGSQHQAALELFQICQSEMSLGSLSFYTAAKLLPQEDRKAIYLLYGWCRAMDDLVDGQNLGHKKSASASPVVSTAEGFLPAQLQDVTQRILQVMKDREIYKRMLGGFISERNSPSKNHVPIREVWPILAMGYLAHEKGLHPFYAEELLKGMAMDLSPPQYETLGELEVYCYHVAGVVGVMYCDIVGLRDQNAKKHAAELGMAMQLTNICRDILDDAEIGRIYLPRALLEQYGIPFDPRELRGYKDALFDLTLEVLARADNLYFQAQKGLLHLPIRAAFAASAACHIYRQIGVEIRRRKARAWDKRCRVHGFRKLLLVFKAALQIVFQVPYRLFHPWQRQIPQTLWRFRP